jgi:TRAP-type mannitol/chloroaromatic compound transport system substrate-binding protein
MYHGGGQEIQQRHFRELFNIMPFTCGQTGLQMAGWFNKEINSLDDFRGLNIRLPGLSGEVMRRVGANPVMVPPQEIFPALASGALDATELQGPWLDTVSGFYQHTRYYYAPGWQEVNSAGEVGLNADVWDSLSERHKAALQRAIEAANSINCGEWAYHNAMFFQTLIHEHEVDVRAYPDDVIDALARVSAEVLAELGEADPRSAEVHASYTDYFRMALEYSARTEVPFFNARARQFAAT